MRDQFLLVMTAVLAANLLTAFFLYGMAKAFKIGANDAAPLTVVIAIVMPLAFVGGGALLFGG